MRPDHFLIPRNGACAHPLISDDAGTQGKGKWQLARPATGGLGAGSVGFTLFLLATKELGPWAFNFNTGYIRNENKIDETQDIWHLSLSGQFKMGKCLSLVADAGLERNTDPDSDTPPAFTIVGFIYSVREGFDVELGIKYGINSPETDWTILAGSTFRF